MEITLLTTREAFEAALASARQAGAGGQVRGMAAPLDASLLGSINTLWDEIETGLNDAFLKGYEVASTFLEKFRGQLDALLQRAGRRAADIQRVLLEKLFQFLKNFVNNTLSLVQAEITVAGRKMFAHNVKLTHRLTLGGKFEVSLQKVFELVGEGELEVEVEYSATPG